MFCIKCGRKLPEDARFCPSCGEKVAQNEMEQIIKMDEIKEIIEQEAEEEEEKKEKEKEEEEKEEEKKKDEEKEEKENIFSNQEDMPYEIEREENFPQVVGQENQEVVYEQEEADDSEKEAQNVVAISLNEFKKTEDGLSNPIKQPNPFANFQMNFSTSVEPVRKKKISKAPIVAGVFLLSIFGLAVFALILSIAGSGKQKGIVTQAIENTKKTLQEEITTVQNPFSEEPIKSHNLDLIISNFSYFDNDISYNLTEGENIEIAMYRNEDTLKDMVNGNISFKMGNKNSIYLDYSSDAEGFYFRLPDLFDKVCYLPKEKIIPEDQKFNNSTAYNTNMANEALVSLGNSMMGLLKELYQKSSCTREGTEILKENGKIRTTKYEVTVPLKDYGTYIRRIPDVIESDAIFMNWLSLLTSEDEAEELIENLRFDLEELYIEDDSISSVILCYVYVNEKNQMVQIEMPYEDEYSVGEFRISLLGTERLSDYIEISLNMNSYDEEYYEQDNMTFLSKREEDKVDVNFEYLRSSDIDEIQFTLMLEDITRADQKPYGYNTNFTMSVNNNYETQLELSGSVSYTMSSSSEVRMLEKKELMDITDLTSEEYNEFIFNILYNLKEKKYFPSWAMSNLINAYLSKNSDLSDLEEEGDISYSYSASGLPILTDYYDAYQIELQGPGGAVLDDSRSDSYYLYYEKDEIDYIYTINYSTNDFGDQFSEERRMYKGDHYKNVNISDIQKKEINGYQVFYQSCSYDYTFGTGYKQYIAWVRLNDEDVFCVLLIDGTNSAEDSILDDCFNTVLPISDLSN